MPLSAKHYVCPTAIYPLQGKLFNLDASTADVTLLNTGEPALACTGNRFAKGICNVREWDTPLAGTNAPSHTTTWMPFHSLDAIFSSSSYLFAVPLDVTALADVSSTRSVLDWWHLEYCGNIVHTPVQCKSGIIKTIRSPRCKAKGSRITSAGSSAPALWLSCIRLSFNGSAGPYQYFQRPDESNFGGPNSLQDFCPWTQLVAAGDCTDHANAINGATKYFEEFGPAARCFDVERENVAQ
eukprot:2407895-Pyramimonas_sp.AAC.1